MDELISRQAAIDAVYDWSNYAMTDEEARNIRQVIQDIKALSSAGPEPKITHCNACKHWKQTTGKMRGFGLGECDFFGIKLVTCNGFCYWAERWKSMRRSDEN